MANYTLAVTVVLYKVQIMLVALFLQPEYFTIYMIVITNTDKLINIRIIIVYLVDDYIILIINDIVPILVKLQSVSKTVTLFFKLMFFKKRKTSSYSGNIFLSQYVCLTT